MPGYWVFVVKDHLFEGRVIPAREVLADRVRNKFWSLNSRAPNVRKLSKGDRVLFYVTSGDGRGFMGKGVLAGAAHPITIEQRFHVIGAPSINFDYAVEFSEAEIWPNLLSLDKLLNKMPLLIGRKRPAAVFRGSIRRISERDYEVVVRAADSLV